MVKVDLKPILPKIIVKVRMYHAELQMLLLRRRLLAPLPATVIVLHMAAS